jgi:hypothetical protein
VKISWKWIEEIPETKINGYKEQLSVVETEEGKIS